MAVNCQTPPLRCIGTPALLLLGLILAFQTTASAQDPSPRGGFRTLHNFKLPGAPAMVTNGSDGSVYGVTKLQQLFRITAAGERTIWQPFKEDVSQAIVRLVGSSNGVYGYVDYPATSGGDYVFRLEASGEVTVLHRLSAEEAFEETSGKPGLIAGNDGFLYGVLRNRRISGQWVAALFQLGPSGDFKIIRFFYAGENTGYGPLALIEGQDGNLYFVTLTGGRSGNGALFRCNQGGTVSTVYSFSGKADGRWPNFLAQGSDGQFYVIAQADGQDHRAQELARISPSGGFTLLHRFPVDADTFALVSGSNGAIYGAMRPYFTPDIIFKYAPDSGVTTFHEFAGLDSGYSLATSNGLLYGVATDNTAHFGYVFRATASGELTRLSEFKPGNNPSGPGGLVRATDGTLYGTTTAGGPAGKGTVYKLALDGTLTILHAFAAPGEDSSPSSLVMGGGDVLYGTTAGPAPSLFRLSTSGAFTVLDTVPGSSSADGYYTLARGRTGVVYGTTGGGDRKDGFVFKIAPDGQLIKLYSFTGGGDGSGPHSLVDATDGNLYGLTSSGGAQASGTVFRLSPNGDLRVLRNFDFGIEAPVPGLSLVQGSDGNLYCAVAGQTLSANAHYPGHLIGMDLNGQSIDFATVPVTVKQLFAGKDGKLYGISAYSTIGYDFGFTGPDMVFSCSFSGAITMLHEFNPTLEGSDSRAFLQGGDGNLYGTLASRGPAGGGAIFELSARPSGILLNLSSRAQVLNGDTALIAGFIISGDGPKNVLVRGIGPSLATAGVSGALGDPTLELFDASGVQIATNDNWASEPGVSATGVAPVRSEEAAILRTLEPGAYTAILRGKDNTGIGLAEVYDVSTGGTTSQLANISSRAFVDGGDNALIAGFIVAAERGGFGRIIARGIGPSLAESGVQNALQDPILTLFDSNGYELAFNDDWRSPRPKEIEETGIPPASDKESAVVISVRPGAYTAILRGVDGAAGIGAVEIYGL